MCSYERRCEAFLLALSEALQWNGEKHQDRKIRHQLLAEVKHADLSFCFVTPATLRYQFNPTTFSYDLVTLMLAKSLHALPSPHFNLCLSLLGEAPVSILPPAANEAQGDDAEQSTPATASASSTSSQPSAGILTDPAIVKLHHLATLLSSSRYPTFWNALHSGEYRELREDVLDRLENFEDGVRRVALQGTASSFQSISRKRLASYLGLEDNAELDDYLKSAEAAQGWTVEGDMVKVPLNRDNHLNKAAAASTANPTVAATQQEVTLGDLNKLLQQAQPSTAGLRA